jgi:hypothetical protein
MKKFAIINKDTNKVRLTYTHTRMKSMKIETNEVQFELLVSNGEHGLDELAYSWDGSAVIFDSEYIPFDPKQKWCKIFRYIPEPNDYNKRVPPVGHDYMRGLDTTLFPKDYFNKGELYKMEYFADDDLTEIIIEVNIVYERDAMGFATKRTTTRSWYLEDGTISPDTKVTVKIYRQGTLGPIEEGIRRRGNIVKGIQMPILGMMLATITTKSGESEPERQARCITLGRRFLEQNKVAFTNFIEDSNRQISQDVEESTDFWIDNVIDDNGTTIRGYVISSLDIGGLE